MKKEGKALEIAIAGMLLISLSGLTYSYTVNDGGFISQETRDALAAQSKPVPRISEPYGGDNVEADNVKQLVETVQYLFEEAYSNAGFEGYTETHIVDGEYTYYSYNPELGIGASWGQPVRKNDGTTFYPNAKLYEVIELMPLGLEVKNKNITSLFKSLEKLETEKGTIRVLDGKTSHTVLFAGDTLLSYTKLGEKNASIYYEQGLNKDLPFVISQVAKSLTQ